MSTNFDIDKAATQTLTEVTRTISLSDFLQSVFLVTISECGLVLFKDMSAAWDLFNINPLALSSPPHQHFKSGWQEVI